MGPRDPRYGSESKVKLETFLQNSSLRFQIIYVIHLVQKHMKLKLQLKRSVSKYSV
jgi:hypothetical protein